MDYRIKAPSCGAVRLSLRLPASKSISNRALVLKALSSSTYDICNLSDSDDTRVMEEAFYSGASDINTGAAGTAMRFMTAFLSQKEGVWTLQGSERMKNRPIKLLADALNSLGARIEYMERDGYPPLRIWGKALRGGEVRLSGGVSSQYISALLMVAPMMEEGLTVHMEGQVISAPYISLTVQLMKHFGAEVERRGNTLKVSRGGYRPAPFTVEPDWSAASYWYAVAALSPGAEIGLEGLCKESLQGDAAVAGLFACLGVETEYTAGGVRLRHTGARAGRMEYDFVNEPDLAQTFATTCAGLNVTFRFTGLQSLRIKETDRMEALRAELRRLGYVIDASRESILEWNGERCTTESERPFINTYEDHRMAMAFAPLSLVCPAGIVIADPEVVTKSYPAFWNDMRKAGFEIIQSPE
ncbi:MAG: 3-phosphoshikimate 1-carboxyvinyltransferase [Tannerellaceae bacterium]|jgi:3-phosphoshikimate 1-carboxyvinyltransferase|nr:3-phosphoshikimate 1-carboxyvinyltransferase [Tannerellaceae bacterium]